MGVSGGGWGVSEVGRGKKRDGRKWKEQRQMGFPTSVPLTSWHKEPHSFQGNGAGSPSPWGEVWLSPFLSYLASRGDQAVRP